MRSIIIATIAVFLFASCQESKTTKASTPVVVEKGDFTGYSETDIGNGLVRLEKHDPQGNLLEEGYAKNGVKTGSWVSYTEGKVRKIRNYIDGQLCGKQFDISSAMTLEGLETYANGQKNGNFQKFRSARIIEDGFFLDGKLHGTHKQCYSHLQHTGKVQKTTEYKNGVLDGKIQNFNEDGDLVLEYIYKDGKKVSGGIVE